MPAVSSIDQSTVTLNNKSKWGPLLADRGDSLLDTMDLIEPTKPLPVPNHLLDTKIYTRVSHNAIVQATPEEVHFGGFEAGKLYTRTIRFINVFSEVTRFHILPPETSYFKLFYTKPERLVPGFSVECTVEFRPDEVRYYYDSLRVHSKDEENNLIIPIHAFPVLEVAKVPEHIKFANVAVGHKETKKIPLLSSSTVDFEFEVAVLQSHSAYSVNPMRGVIPARGETSIHVTFAPFDFVTARLALQITVSEFNSKPFICNVTGYSEPGLERRLVRQAYGDFEEFPDAAVLDPRILSPLDRCRHNKKQPNLIKKTTTEKNPLPLHPPAKQIVKHAGLRFPTKLNTPHAVASVLNQKAGKLSIKELREAMEKASATEATRQMKEAVFEQRVREDIYEERQNQLRWQVKLGQDPMPQKAKENVVMEREISWIRYKKKRGDPDFFEELERRVLELGTTRPYRSIRSEEETQVLSHIAQFDKFANNEWLARQEALIKFREAAWRVVHRYRASKRLKGLRQMKEDWIAGKIGGPPKTSTSELDPDEALDIAKAVQLLEDELATPVPEKEVQEKRKRAQETVSLVTRVGTITFPCADPASGKGGLGDAGSVEFPVPPTEVSVRHHVTYFDLCVPQHWKLSHYDRLDIQEVSRGYVPLRPTRQLQEGVQDEVIVLPLPEDLEVEDLEPMEKLDLQLVPHPLTSEKTKVIKDKTDIPNELLQPPPALFHPIHYPPLHIFNPSPGLQMFHQPLSYSETDLDFHLCPLPRYVAPESGPVSPHLSTQKRYLDPDQVIRGATTWRKFPSPSLTSLQQSATLTSVWLPRWSDSFSHDILAPTVPTLLDGLPAEDAANILEDESTPEIPETSLSLTPEMLLAEFPILTQHPDNTLENAQIMPTSENQSDFPFADKIPSGSHMIASASAPVPRWHREKELDYFITRRSNRLGEKVNQRSDHMQSFIVDKRLNLE